MRRRLVDFNKNMDLMCSLSCDINGVSFESIFERSRKKNVVHARQMVYYFARKTSHKEYPFERIADYFKLHHATVIHGVKNYSGLSIVDVNTKRNNKIFEKEILTYEHSLRDYKLEALTKKQRDVLDLYSQGYLMEDISEILGITTSALYMRMHIISKKFKCKTMRHVIYLLYIKPNLKE